MKRIVYALLFIFSLFLLTSCTLEKAPFSEAPSNNPKLQVVVSFNAMRELAQAIGGNKIEIKTIIPDGVEPHDFEPKASDVTALSNASVFIINGFGMEQAWAEKAIKTAGNKNLLFVIASNGATPIYDTASSAFWNNQSQRHDIDPHIWLSLQGAKWEAKNIHNAFIKADPSNKAYYDANYDEFAAKLDHLYTDYKTKFDQSPNKVFVTGHAAFSYMARDFGLQQNSLENVFASGEPSARRLKELADFCLNHHISTIFVEDMESPKISQTLAHEVGANVEGIYTLESSDSNKTYLQTQEENLEKIYQSLSPDHL